MILDTIAQHFNEFSLSDLTNALSNPANIGIILSLIVIEGLLSADNALVLAMMVEHLPPKKRKKALFYGIIGSYVFRFLAIGFGTLIIGLWWVKLIGALYLLWISLRNLLFNKKRIVSKFKAHKTNFWKTVLAVELVDMAFSFDSVLSALGVSEVLWVLLLGSIFGIILMRCVAGALVKFISHHKQYEKTAYILVGFVAIKMLLSIINIQISEEVFIVFMFIIFFTSYIMGRKHE
jgi:YkoY family integral membrane protein